MSWTKSTGVAEVFSTVIEIGRLVRVLGISEIRGRRDCAETHVSPSKIDIAPEVKESDLSQSNG